MEFKEKLFELRRAAGLSQEEVANKLGVSRQTVSKWEGGQSTPEMDKLPALSELFAVSLDYLLKPSEVDVLSIKTAQLEKQQQALEAKLQRKHKASFLVVSIVVGILLFLACSTALTGYFYSPENYISGAGWMSFLLFLFTALVIVANYLHSRLARRR